MKTRGFLVGSVVLLAASCSNDDDRRRVDTGGTGRPIGSVGAGGDASNPGGTANEGQGAGGSIGHLGGGGSLEIGGAPSAVPALCEIDATWSEAQRVGGIATEAGDERLLAMTHDELTVVFTRNGAPFIADRAKVEEPFAVVPLKLPNGFTLKRGLAIAPDGLGLVVPTEGGDTFADFERSTRGAPFGAPNTQRFANIASNAMLYGAALAWPVLSRSGQELFFAQLKPGNSQVYRTDGSEVFALPISEDPGTLGGRQGEFKLPHSVSADARSLFFYDEGQKHAVGLWSSEPGAPHYERVDYADLENVFTSDGCERLYGTREGGGSGDVVVLSRD